MDAQTVQKSHRLPRGLVAVGFLVGALFFGSCARDLRKDSDLSVTPEEFEQKIVAVDIEKMAAASAPVDSAVTSSGKPKALPTNKASKPPSEKVTSKGNVTKSELKVPVAKPNVVRVWPITMGEKSSYNLRWGVIEGGVAHMEVKPFQDIDGTPSIHYSGVVKSSKMMDLFYKIDNTIDTWVRLSDLAPLRQEIKQNESARFGRRVMLIDPEKKEVKFYEHLTKTNDGSKKEDKRLDSMSTGAQDLFGALYFYRFVQTFSDPNFKFPIHDKGKNWFADMKFEDRESIRVPAGVFQTKRYKVAPRLEGTLKPKGDVLVWITDDDRSLLVKFNAKIKVGSVTGELIEHSTGTTISVEIPFPMTPVGMVDASL